MESLLLPASIVGCSVSVLFALSTFVVLGCYRERTRPLMIKQQLALSLAFTYIVVLSGLQGYENKTACRTVTILIHYGVLASFLWILVDIYHTMACVKRKTFPQKFIKVLIFMWGVPLLFLIMAIIIGVTITSNFNPRSKFYTCWKSDHLIWTLVLPCLLVFLASCYYLITSSNAVFSRGRTNPSQKERRSIQAIKYSIKTNVVMLILTMIIWIFACEIFWYNKDVKYQLVFGLTVGVQGLFLFFFYCVFCLEHDLYVSDNIVDDFSSHFYDEVECSPGTSNFLDYQDGPAKETRESVTEEQPVQTLKSNFVRDESFKIIETDPDSVPRLVSEANFSDRIDNTSKTKVLIHTPEKTHQHTEKENINGDNNISNNKEDDVNNNYQNHTNNVSKNSRHSNDMSTKETKENTNNINSCNNNDNNTENDSSVEKTEIPTENIKNNDNNSIDTKTEEKKTFVKSSSVEKSKRRSYTGSEFSLGDDLAIRPRLGSSTSPLQSEMSRQTRSSSRSSQSSFASNMGLNELESLFNNPDLMKQSISNRNRLRNNQDELNKQRKNKDMSSPKTSSTKQRENDTNVKAEETEETQSNEKLKKASSQSSSLSSVQESCNTTEQLSKADDKSDMSNN